MSPPLADPLRLLSSLRALPPGLRQCLKSDSGWRLHGESGLRPGTTFYPCDHVSMIGALIPCSSTDDSKPELEGKRAHLIHDVLVERPEASRSPPPALSALDSLSKPVRTIPLQSLFLRRFSERTPATQATFFNRGTFFPPFDTAPL